MKARTFGLIAALGLQVACKPATPIGPPGEVTLSYVGQSDPEYFFVLENRTTKDISLSVAKSIWSGSKPWGSALGCSNSDSSYETSIWPALDDSERGEPIKMRSGERLSFKIEKNDFGTSRHSGPCTLTIWLEDRKEVKSKEFKP
jgi:hypothetical protein